MSIVFIWINKRRVIFHFEKRLYPWQWPWPSPNDTKLKQHIVRHKYVTLSSDQQQHPDDVNESAAACQ